MRSYAERPRPKRIRPTVRRTSRFSAAAPTLTRARLPEIRRNVAEAPRPEAESGPYLDYGRWLTPEGGILIIYKDLDVRLRHIAWRVVAWIAFTAFEARFLFTASPVESTWINGAVLLAVASINFLILWKLPEVHRSVEIRPDCMILDGTDVFWLDRMDAGWPTFDEDEKGNRVLSGIYGTRFVEYLTARRFDEYDRMPDVFSAHLKEAMMQLWAPPEASGTWHESARRWQR